MDWVAGTKLLLRCPDCNLNCFWGSIPNPLCAKPRTDQMATMVRLFTLELPTGLQN